MFFPKTGTVSRKTYNAYRVGTYSEVATIKCKLVFGTGNDQWFDGAPNFDTYRLFTRTMDLQINDKVVIDGTNYVIESMGIYVWVMKQYTKYFVKKSQWE